MLYSHIEMRSIVHDEAASRSSSNAMLKSENRILQQQKVGVRNSLFLWYGKGKVKVRQNVPLYQGIPKEKQQNKYHRLQAG